MQKNFRLFLFVIAWIILPIGVWLYSNLNPDAPSCVYEQKSNLKYNAGCLVIMDNKILLIKHRFKNIYGIPAGTFDESDEDSTCTAHRETFEESFVDVKVGRELMKFPDKNFILFECHPIKRNGNGYEEINSVDEIITMIERNNFKSLEVGSVEMMSIEKFRNLTNYRYKDQQEAIISMLNK